jgi:putative phosphoribosyl transferase
MMTGSSVTVVVDPRGALDGDLVIPDSPLGLVVFAHGSGSSRASPRNRFVAERLQHGGLATLLIDLLTADEEQVDRRTGQHRFDIELLARRLERILEWIPTRQDLAGLPVGLFGASTGAAAALAAAARAGELVAAVVSRGGRPDLAGRDLAAVTSPTLLIVGSEDHEVLQLNRAAGELLAGEWRIEIVDGASHLFEEPGTLERVAELAAGWFVRHFDARGSRTP